MLYFNEVKLVDGVKELIILPAEGNGHRIFLKELDLGFPTVREVTTDKPDRDGTDDYTRLYGSRAVSMSVRIFRTEFSSIPESVQELRQWLRPSERPKLVFTIEGVSRQMTLRAAQYTAPLGLLALRGDALEMQLQWVAPDPFEYSPDLSAAESILQGVGVGGRNYPRIYPLTYDTTPSGGIAVLNNLGTESTFFTATIIGPVNAPKLYNETGVLPRKFEMGSLDLDSGHSVVLDFAKRTAWLDGIEDTAHNMRGKITVADWWPLAPGANTVRYWGASTNPLSITEFTWRNAWF